MVDSLDKLKWKRDMLKEKMEKWQKKLNHLNEKIDKYGKGKSVQAAPCGKFTCVGCGKFASGCEFIEKSHNSEADENTTDEHGQDDDDLHDE